MVKAILVMAVDRMAVVTWFLALFMTNPTVLKQLSRKPIPSNMIFKKTLTY